MFFIYRATKYERASLACLNVDTIARVNDKNMLRRAQRLFTIAISLKKQMTHDSTLGQTLKK